MSLYDQHLIKVDDSEIVELNVTQPFILHVSCLDVDGNSVPLDHSSRFNITMSNYVQLASHQMLNGNYIAWVDNKVELYDRL